MIHKYPQHMLMWENKKKLLLTCSSYFSLMGAMVVPQNWLLQENTQNYLKLLLLHVQPTAYPTFMANTAAFQLSSDGEMDTFAGN